MEKSAEIQLSIMDDRTHVAMQRMGLIECYPWWNDDRRCDPFWRLYANERLGGALCWEGQDLPLRPGEVTLVPPWCAFASRVQRPGTGHLYMHFTILNLLRPVTEKWFPQPISIRDPLCSEAVSLARAALRGEQGPAVLCHGKLVVYACLARAIEALPAAARISLADLVDGSNPLAPAMGFIEDNLAEHITVEEIASRCRLGNGQFTRLFRKAFGQSPHHYLMDRRVAAVARLLMYGNEGLETIAERCGFTDRAHMSKLFHRQFGISPAAYRKGRARSPERLA